MEINVKNCNYCPFLISDYDDYADGFDTVDYCNLARFLKLKEDIVSVYNSYDEQVSCDYCKTWDIDSNEFDYSNCKCEELFNELEDSKEKPEWCPINKEDYIIR